MVGMRADLMAVLRLMVEMRADQKVEMMVD